MHRALVAPNHTLALLVLKIGRQQDFPQQVDEAARQRHHRQHEHSRNYRRQSQVQRIGDEQRGHHHADQQRAGGRQEDRTIDLARAPEQHLQLIARRPLLVRRIAVGRFQPLFQRTRAIDDAREAIGQHQHVGTHTREQKHRRDSELNDVADLSGLDVHVVVMR